MKMRTSLVLASLLALTFCLGYGQTVEKPLSFDAASVKASEITQTGGRGGGNAGRLQVTPGRVFGRGVTTRQIILEAYHNLTDHQISGGPNWLDVDTFDLDARTEVAADIDQVRTMLRALLAERFKLIVRSEKKEMPVYALTVAKSALGPQIHPINKEDSDPPTEKLREMLGKNHASAGRATINFIRGNMEEFAHRLSALHAVQQSDVAAVAAHAAMDPLSVITGPPIDRPVLDKTGLTGDYFIVLAWNFDEDVKSLLEEETGLKLVSEKALVDTLTIDHIEKPDPN
jgi:uncharacterized protein (TIGR03435 family)